ncbi:MAG: TlpA disulfide reductase family protein [Pseudomonadota bacterium]
MTENKQRPGLALTTYLVVAMAAVTAGFGLYHLWNKAQAPISMLQPPSAHPTAVLDVVGQHRPQFYLPDLNGQLLSIDQWDGKVVLINFWATWCPPCLKEIPAFIETLEVYGNRGFQIVGVAIDEPEAVIDLINDLGAQYPQLISADNGVELAKRYGNRYGALPYSVLIDREGIIRFTKPGELHREVLESHLEKLL